MDFSQASNSTFSFRSLSCTDKVGVASASNRPKMSLPPVAKTKEPPIVIR